jgi:hypothetical protein
MNRSKIFAAAFIVLAFLSAWWMVQRVPHYVTLHVNQRWHIMLVGEDRTSVIKFNTNEFQVIREDHANLWLTGNGEIRWLEQRITIENDSIIANNHNISTSIKNAEVNIMFYPDGRVTKGNLTLK